jgi:hypothetical protein
MNLLPNLFLYNKVNVFQEYSGIDSEQHCLDKVHFKQYPWPISYQYNSRGFRDQEWPTALDQLKDCIWCIGDSFTVGIGSPIEHTWCHILSQGSGKKTINISMDGASNDWISRISQDIAQLVNPTNMVIMWSYIHRRESPDYQPRDVNYLGMQEIWQEYYQAIRGTNWPDCDAISDFAKLPASIREEIKKYHSISQFVVSNDLSSIQWSDNEAKRMHFSNELDCQDLNNFQQAIDRIRYYDNNINIIHSVVPELSPKRFIDQCGQMLNYKNQYIGYFSKLDLARDGHHFDRITAQTLVNSIIPLLR